MLLGNFSSIFCASFEVKNWGTTFPGGRVLSQSPRVRGMVATSILCKVESTLQKVLLQHYLDDIASKLYIQEIFAIFCHIAAKHPDQNGLLEKKLAKIQFPYTFVQELNFATFCEGVCHYDVKEAKSWLSVYLPWFDEVYLGWMRVKPKTEN